MCKSLLHGVADRRRESRWGTGQGAGCGGDRGGEVEMNSRICQFACPPGSSTYWLAWYTQRSRFASKSSG